MTDLHSAAWMGFMDEAKRCLEQGADINAKGPGGRTPISFACQGDREEMVRYLLDNGADPFICDDNGEDASDWAEAIAGEAVKSMIQAARQSSPTTRVILDDM